MKKPLILVIDDNPRILKNLKISLEFNEYRVFTATSAEKGLKLLKESNSLPDVIVCDIMLPEMSGYDFFKEIYKNPLWNAIPFIFLSAKSEPEDVRFGKMLGADDYITKPFREEELLAAIKGKIRRKKKTIQLAEEIEKMMDEEEVENFAPHTAFERFKVALIHVVWDDEMGPQLSTHHPQDGNVSYSLERIGGKLYQCSRLMYGSDKILEPEGLLIKMESIDRWCYVYFDSYPDHGQRSGRKEYMLGVLSPGISYLESLNVKEILQSLSKDIKNSEDPNFEDYWQEIADFLSSRNIS